VHNAVRLVEVHQTSQDGFGDLSQHVHPNRAKVLGDTVERPARQTSLLSANRNQYCHYFIIYQ
jgi:hypothetical protein